jgi:hypothetical protein
MDVEHNKRKIRIVSGLPLEVETQVNLMLGEYTPMSWTVSTVGDHIELLCLLALDSELRKQQLGNLNGAPIGRR